MTITIHSIDTIATAAQEFIAQMGDNKIFAFYGAMGAGKTTFVKALCEAMGVTDTVNSPTFAIVNEYDTPSGRPIYHFDFYRINRLQEAIEIGLYDYLDSTSYYTTPVQKESRSRMNVVWRLPSEELDAQFVKEATAAGLTSLKGHRIVGGCRASIYNAMPMAGVDALIAFMRDFEKRNG